MKVRWHLIALLFAGSAAFAQSIPEQQDARVIEQLVEAGSDISKPHDIDFYLYFPTESQATAAAAEIETLGYDVALIDEPRPPDRSEWLVHATKRMAPQLEAMTASTRALETLAAKHGGEYDGWGTAVVQ